MFGRAATSRVLSRATQGHTTRRRSRDDHVIGLDRPSPAAQAAVRRELPLFAAGGLGLLASELLIFAGTIWDIQWHQDVGPDTFFTAPHLLVYSGAMFAGLSCLAVVLACTWRARQPGAPSDPAVVPILRRTFWAPPGFILGGIGASLWLVFGLYDQWWHRIYGFDVTLESAPHTGLSLADMTTLVGCISVFTLLVVRSTAHSARLAEDRPGHRDRDPADRHRRPPVPGDLAVATTVAGVGVDAVSG
jgi:hypothetical protein